MRYLCHVMRQAESSRDTVQRRKNSCLQDAFVFFLWQTSIRQPIAVIGDRCRSRTDNPMGISSGHSGVHSYSDRAQLVPSEKKQGGGEATDVITICLFAQAKRSTFCGQHCWMRSGTPVFGRRTDPVLRSTFN